MWLPISSGEAVAQRRFGVFEPDTFRTLSEIVRPGFTVVEIGACYGEFTIQLSQLVGRSGRVYAFELFPPYFDIAQRNVALNRLTNVQLVNRAVGAPGEPPVSVALSAPNPYASLGQISHLDYSLRERAVQTREHDQADVETISLRQFLERESLTPDLIFMDIEGCELEVLHDVQPILRAGGNRPVIYFELHRAFYGPDGVTWIADLFERAGYRTRRIDEHLLCIPERPPGAAPAERFTP
jgi:FkbM family methyltransferase